MQNSEFQLTLDITYWYLRTFSKNFILKIELTFHILWEIKACFLGVKGYLIFKIVCAASGGDLSSNLSFLKHLLKILSLELKKWM